MLVKGNCKEKKSVSARKAYLHVLLLVNKTSTDLKVTASTRKVQAWTLSTIGSKAAYIPLKTC